MVQAAHGGPAIPTIVHGRPKAVRETAAIAQRKIAYGEKFDLDRVVSQPIAVCVDSGLDHAIEVPRRKRGAPVNGNAIAAGIVVKEVLESLETVIAVTAATTTATTVI